MCGKDMKPTLLKLGFAGSPPHVRERRKQHRRIYQAVGITPACAGKTPGQARKARRNQDHPRMCGKDLFLSLSGSVR